MQAMMQAVKQAVRQLRERGKIGIRAKREDCNSRLAFGGCTRNGMLPDRLPRFDCS
jgi:hypothetical protein